MPLNILVVDDSATMRKMIIRTLNLSGLPVGEIHEAGNGKQGLMMLAMHNIDLALVDINMPEMNGEEMIDRVKSNPNLKDLPVVVVSTEGSTTRIASLLARNGVGYVHKPFTPEHLSHVVHEVTGGAYGSIVGEPPVQGGGPDF
ncbi:MAG: response regulator [Acidobacteriota bacterium]